MGVLGGRERGRKEAPTRPWDLGLEGGGRTATDGSVILFTIAQTFAYLFVADLFLLFLTVSMPSRQTMMQMNQKGRYWMAVLTNLWETLYRTTR